MGAGVVTLASSLTYQPMSRIVKSLTYGNGLTQTDTVTLDYELSQLLLQNGATALINCTRARTDLLNLTRITDAVAPANNMRLAYTPANRLSSATGPWGSLSWTCNTVGNRLTFVGAADLRPRLHASDDLSAAGGCDAHLRLSGDKQ